MTTRTTAPGHINFAALRMLLPSLPDIIQDAGVRLTPQGSRLFASCPFHDDSSPSFSTYPDGQRCGCLGCGWNGDVFGFVQKFYDLPDAAAAARWLCNRFGITAPNGDAPAATPKRKTRRGPEIEHYDYTDLAGVPQYRVFRYALEYEDDGSLAPGKTFGQRRILPNGSLARGMDGVTYYLYRAPAVAAADTVWICEGERDVHALERLGVVATTDAGGVGATKQFVARGYPEHLRGKHVILVPDTDRVGRERGAAIAHALYGISSRVQIVTIPAPHKDVRDYLAGTVDASIDALLALAVDYVPAAAPPEPEPAGDATTSTTSTAAASVTANWHDLLLFDRQRNPRPVVANVLTVLRHCPEWQGVLWHNEFSQDSVARRPFPGFENAAGEIVWTDRHDTLLLEWLNHNSISVGIDVVGRAVQAVAEEQKYHPVREYLQDVASRWDGTERIDTWLQDYLHVPHGRYHYAVGARWLISAVARVFQPGCKADCCLILEGEQGIRKSTALRILGEPWFTDEIADLGSKDAAIQTRGVWIIEIAELDSMRRVEMGRVKAFMSRGTDRYRPPYGKRPIDYPRQCIFAGSVNHGTYLQDETGGRRFWPVECRDIDADGLHAVRDQLWAEAVIRYRAGAPWWLDTANLITEADTEQRARFEGDPWEERIAGYLASKNEVSITQILDSCVSKPTKDWQQVDKNRVGRVLRSLRWTRFQGRNVDGDREWRYRPSRLLPINDDDMPPM